MTNKIKDIERKKFKISLGTPGFRKRYRRVGSFKYKTLRGSMITPEIAVINCVIFPKKNNLEKSYVNLQRQRFNSRLARVGNFIGINSRKEISRTLLNLSHLYEKTNELLKSQTDKKKEFFNRYLSLFNFFKIKRIKKNKLFGRKNRYFNKVGNNKSSRLSRE